MPHGSKAQLWFVGSTAARGHQRDTVRKFFKCLKEASQHLGIIQLWHAGRVERPRRQIPVGAHMMSQLVQTGRLKTQRSLIRGSLSFVRSIPVISGIA